MRLMTDESDAGEVETDVEGKVNGRHDFCVTRERQFKIGNKMR